MSKIALSAKNLTKVYQKSKGSDNSTLALNKLNLEVKPVSYTHLTLPTNREV